jgi:hypothetical protein
MFSSKVKTSLIHSPSVLTNPYPSFPFKLKKRRKTRDVTPYYNFKRRILTTNPAHIPRPLCFIEMIGHAEVTRLEADASVALTAFEVIYHSLYNSCHAGDMIFADTEDSFGIQVEIVVGDNITHTFGTFPVHGWILCQKSTAREPVKVFQAFTNGDKHHSDRIKPVDAVISSEKIIRGSQ